MNEKPIIDNIIKSVEAERIGIIKEFDALPNGFLRIKNNCKYSQWHAVFRGNSSSIGRKNGWRLVNKFKTKEGIAYEYYLPKGERDFARSMAMREYYERRLIMLDRLSSILNDYQKISMYDNSVVNKSMTEKYAWRNQPFTEEKQQLVREAWAKMKGTAHVEELAFRFGENGCNIYDEWMHRDYPTNPKHPEGRIFKTASGIMVRSRIEVIIADLLTYNNLPFRYEARFEASWGVDFYPDFYIINPASGKEYVWEHFGLLHESGYIREGMWKVEELVKKGYVPGDTLLLTGELHNNEINMNAVISTVQFIVDDKDGNIAGRKMT